MLLSIIALGLIAIVCGFLLFFIPEFRDHGILLMTGGQTAAELSGLILLVLNGTLTKTKYWNYIVFGAFLMAMSFVFKILHLPGSREIFGAGLVLIEVTYTVRFVKCNYSSPLDWMKYTWTGAWYSATIFIVFLHWSELWWLPSGGLFWITIWMFLKAHSNPNAGKIVKATRINGD